MGYGIVNTGFPVQAEAFDPAGSAAAAQANLAVHVADKNNPHGVSPGQIGAAAASHTHDASQERWRGRSWQMQPLRRMWEVPRSATSMPVPET